MYPFFSSSAGKVPGSYIVSGAQLMSSSEENYWNVFKS